MMSRTIVLALFLGLFSESYAQETEETGKMPRNAFYAELAGNSLLISVNYERIFVQKPGLGTAFRLGFMAIPADAVYFSVPTELVLIMGEQKHFGEISGGMTILSRSRSSSCCVSQEAEARFLPTFRAGYRYLAPKGFLLRTGLNFYFGEENIPFVLPGISFGKSF